MEIIIKVMGIIAEIVEIVIKTIGWVIVLAITIVISPIIVPLTLVGLKQYDKFLDKLKKQNRYLTQTELEDKLKIQKGTFIVRHCGKFSELWWTSEQFIPTQPLTLTIYAHNLSLEDDAFYKSHYLDENFGKAFLIELSYWEAEQFYKDIPASFKSQ